MAIYTLVDRSQGVVLQSYNTLQDSFKLPNGDWVDWPTVGYENGPYKFYEVIINTSGSGSVVSDGPSVYDANLDVVTVARTLSNPTPSAVISYEAFQERFSNPLYGGSTAEFDAVTDYVYETNLTTGKPKRRALIQGLSRAMAKNAVDLLGARTIAFMDALVAGGVITIQRKTEILAP